MTEFKPLDCFPEHSRVFKSDEDINLFKDSDGIGIVDDMLFTEIIDEMIGDRKLKIDRFLYWIYLYEWWGDIHLKTSKPDNLMINFLDGVGRFHKVLLQSGIPVKPYYREVLGYE